MLTFVIVDVSTVNVADVGTVSPQGAQISVQGMNRGEAVTITGHTANGFTWKVRGSESLATEPQLVVTDYAAPVNVPITYTVETSGNTFVSSPITVNYGGKYVLQSVDGRTVIPFFWQDNGDPKQLSLRTRFYPVPGRTSQVVRWDVAGGESGQLRIRTERSATDLLYRHLREYGPIFLLRTDGTVRDLPPVQYIAVSGASNILWERGGISSDRVWTLAYEVINDPEPTLVIPTSTWDDFDTVYATWDDHDADWAGATYDQRDREDWRAR